MVGQVYGAHMHRALAAWFFAVVALGLCTACDPVGTVGCDKPFAEPIDPNSSQHLLPGVREPRYLTNPPTSGAHRPGTYATGVVASPIARPEQVTLLEQGEVLVQYKAASTSTRADLRRFVHKTAHVTVAPNASLRSPIVVTAWLWKMNCRAFSDSALRDFVKAHQPAQPVSG
ncbi:MAG: hypothetical protein QOJ00_443 [Actinomycetota bacterium]|jgi:hypothetical protein